jgi:hypothetical protein
MGEQVKTKAMSEIGPTTYTEGRTIFPVEPEAVVESPAEDDPMPPEPPIGDDVQPRKVGKKK